MKDHERAAQVWAVLAQAATNRQTLTYERLSPEEEIRIAEGGAE